jgi:predicted unusual protein kinase regulating ubiquinone biosynthesis (AarF/ABC1/UbiB family)
MRLGQYIGHLKYAFPSEFCEVLKELNDKPNYQSEEYPYIKKHL